jgi:hypothetical protein
MTEAVSVGDIRALADFLARLTAFNTELADGLAKVRGHWSGVGGVWNDDMYRRLGEALGDVTPGIDRYLAATEHHEAYLRELIHRLEEVVRLRGGW